MENDKKLLDEKKIVIEELIKELDVIQLDQVLAFLYTQNKELLS